MYVDLPTGREIEHLLSASSRPCVSIYLPTRPDSDGEAERIGWKNSAADALDRLTDLGIDTRARAPFEALFEDLVDDPAFWLRQANTLAVFTDGEQLRAYHLPSRLEPIVKVTDRFFVKPLLRAVTFPQACFVLALAQGGVRLLEVGADFGPYDVPVDGMPADASQFTSLTSRDAQSPMSRLQGDEGHKVRVRQFARAVDRAVRDTLRGQDLPLVLAAAAPMDAIYREVSTAPNLAAETLQGNPESTPDHELAASARSVLDQLYAAHLDDLRATFEERAGQQRTATDLSDIARAATYGQVDTLVVDIDAVVLGGIEADGAITFDDAGYDVVDEAARRVLQSSGRVVAVRADDVPGGGAAAAVLRYA